MVRARLGLSGHGFTIYARTYWYDNSLHLGANGVHSTSGHFNLNLWLGAAACADYLGPIQPSPEWATLDRAGRHWTDLGPCGPGLDQAEMAALAILWWCRFL